MAKKNALGRGLGALIQEASSEELEKTSTGKGASASSEIDIHSIEANPFQPRGEFDEEALQELSDSIKEIGIVQPMTVRDVGNGKYQLIAGERRLRACKLAGLKTVPAFVRTADDQGMLEMALVENIQREDLNAIEVALSYQRLMDDCKLTQEAVSTRVGKKRSTVTNYMRLLKLPPEIQAGIKAKLISMGHARALINIDDPQIRLDTFQQIIEEEFSVRKTEELVRDLNNPVEVVENITPNVPEELGMENTLTQEYIDFQNTLSNKFQTKVQFKRNEEGIGKIVIPFSSDNELQRIMEFLDQLNV